MKPSSITLFNAKHDDLKSAKREWSARLLKTKRVKGFGAFARAASIAPEQNVVGVAVGEQIVNGKRTGVMVVKFFVRVKYPKRQLSKKTLLPKSINGLPVDVEETGLFRRLGAGAPRRVAKVAPQVSGKALDASMPNPQAKWRPAQPGCSIGFRDPTDQSLMAGTFGAVVTDANCSYILSNNHVLADEDQLAPGAPIYQPGLLDDQNAGQIAALTRAVRLQANVNNTVDCAIAVVADPTLLSKEVLYIGAPNGSVDAALDMPVHKFGRSTNYTVGQVTSTNADVSIAYDTGTFTFEEQIMILGVGDDPFSDDGDSGSLIMKRDTNQAVGLLFGAADSHTVANHIGDVLSALNVTLA